MRRQHIPMKPLSVDFSLSHHKSFHALFLSCCKRTLLVRVVNRNKRITRITITQYENALSTIDNYSCFFTCFSLVLLRLFFFILSLRLSRKTSTIKKNNLLKPKNNCRENKRQKNSCSWQRLLINCRDAKQLQE